MKKKQFLISIDTEGDNLWDWKQGKRITTENTKYLQRFQDLCDKYGFKPTYLTNYEMAADDKFVTFAKKTLSYNGCEIGMHLHAWNSPPEHSLTERSDGENPGCAYLIEYPDKVMEAKISFMTTYLEERFGVRPTTHRAGRWAMDDRYFKLLEKYGYETDCSVTPGKDWRDCSGFTDGSCGSNYSNYPSKPYIVEGTNILEVPVTVKENHRVKVDEVKTVKHIIGNYYRAWKGQGKIWLRPNGRNLDDMIYLSDVISKKSDNYLMFMLHSSEFMPGGSWVFNTEEEIERLYEHLEILFKHISKNYVGSTIGEYAQSFREKVEG